MPAFRAIQLGPMGHKARIQAMRAGIVALGGEVVTVDDNRLAAIRSVTALGDVAFAFTCGMHAREAVARGFLRGLGVPLLVLDCGYFRRACGAKDTEGYNQLGLGGLWWTPPLAVDAERFAAHGITVAEPVQGRGKVALILGQVPGDSQHGLNEAQLVRWLEEEAARLLAQATACVSVLTPRLHRWSSEGCGRSVARTGGRLPRILPRPPSASPTIPPPAWKRSSPACQWFATPPPATPSTPRCRLDATSSTTSIASPGRSEHAPS